MHCRRITVVASTLNSWYKHRRECILFMRGLSIGAFTNKSFFIMPKTSFIEELPSIVKNGKKEVEKIMENIADGRRLKLQTNEIVIPSKDSNYQQLFQEFSTTYSENQRNNRLLYGDNLLLMAALLAGDEENGLESLRGKIDLIYIDPPFDSKADYRTKIILPNVSE